MNDIIVFLPPDCYREITMYRWWMGRWADDVYRGVMKVQGLVVEPCPTPANWHLIAAG